MKVLDSDIIKVHQTTKDFTVWYRESIEDISKYTDCGSAHLLMRYSIMEALKDVLIFDPDEPEKSKDDMFDMCVSIFNALGDAPNENVVRNCIDGNKDYIEFMAQYRLNHYPDEKNIGRYWLKTADSMRDSTQRQLNLLNDLVFPVTWTYAYAKVYAYQFTREHMCNLAFKESTMIPRNYWKLKELEIWLDNYPNVAEEEYCIYLTRENLLYDLVEHGVYILEAIKLTRRIRQGRGLTEEQKKFLRQYGYPYIEDVCKIRYLRSVAGTFENVFSVNRLI